MSLLDSLTPTGTDPAYAAARLARPAGGPPPRSGPRLALVLLVVAALVGLALGQQRRDAPERLRVRAELADRVQTEVSEDADLTARVVDSRTELEQERAMLLSATADGRRSAETLDRLQSAAAAVPLRGPGLRVVLTDAPTPSSASTRAGATPEAGRVLDHDLQSVVNQLWASGAQAISVDGVRLGPGTAIRTAGRTVLVDYRPTTSPYVVVALGDSERIERSFVPSLAAARLRTASSLYGFGFQVRAEAGRDALAVPAAGTGGLRTARPA